MPPLRRPLACAWLLATILRVSAVEWRIPPLSGELTGDIASLQRADAPKLHWRMAARDLGDGRREITCALDGPEARVRVSATVDAAGSGTWRIDDSEIDLGKWYSEVVVWLFQRSAKFNIGGTLRVTGDGTLQAGEPSGRATLVLREGRFEAAERKSPVLFDGIALELTFEDVGTLRTAPAQLLTWRGGHYGPLTLGAGKMRFALAGDRVSVQDASLAVFAGELSLGAFAFSFARPEFEVPAKVRGFEMAMLLPYLPSMVADARGRLDGSMQLRWAANELSLGDGTLTLRPGEKAEVRFLPQPGFLAGSLPTALTKYYTGLADLEQGKVPLRADSLTVAFTPRGDAEGRTAVINLAGGPADPRLQAPVDLTFNVRGPLEWLVNFGMKLH
jgi:hypothetical protein